MGRNHPFFMSDVPAPRAPRSLAGHQPYCQVRYPKLGVAALEYIVGFFDLVYQDHGAESIVLLFWNQRKQRYKLCVPRQEATVLGIVTRGFDRRWTLPTNCRYRCRRIIY